MITIENLHKTYAAQNVLKGIHLHLNAAQSIALIGPNGAGKTTLIKAILGLIHPDNGNIRVLGQDIQTSPQYRKNIGYMPQLSRFPEQMKVKQLFALTRKIRNDCPPQQYDLSLYQDFQIAKMENKALSTLSGGMKQQVSAALAFYFQPQIILLDEPTAGLDPVSNDILKTKINATRQHNRLIITTSHILHDLEEICDHLIYLSDGSIALDKPIHEVSNITGETRLNNMILKLLTQQKSYAQH